MLGTQAVSAQAPVAPPAPGGGLTVEEAVSLAIRQNPRLTAVVRDVEAARAGVRSARALTNPSLVFTPAVIRGGSDEELLLQQPLELNGTRSARAGVAQAQLRQTQAEAVVELRTVVAAVKSAYYDLARSQELRTIAHDVLKTVEEFDHSVRRQSEEGLRPGIDPVQTGIEATRARQQVVLAESQVRQAQSALNNWLGRSAIEPVVVATPIAFTSVTVDRDALVSQALAARAEIHAEAAQKSQFQQEARLARAQGRPDLAPQLRAESLLRSPRQPGVGIGITLPFLDYGSRRNRIRQAEASSRAQDARIEAARTQVQMEVVQAVARLEAAEQVVRSYQSGVLDQSRRLLEGSLKALQIGAPGASILTALEAQRTYRSVLTDYTTALADHARARAELERAAGAIPADLLPATTPSRISP